MNEDQMFDQLGSMSTGENVHSAFDGKSVDEIAHELTSMFGPGDHEELAEEIFSFCN